MYVQVYLLTILYSYWIATDIIPYLLYFVVLVYEYLSVCNLSLEIQGAFMGDGVLPYLGMVGRFCGDLVPIVLAPSFCRKDQFVSITFSCRDTWT